MEAIEVHLPESELKLAPVGDIQYGEVEGCDVDKLSAHIEFGVGHGWRFLGMGDYTDFASPGNRARLQAAGLYDDSNRLISAAALRWTDQLFDLALAPSEGQWLGLLEGHHFLNIPEIGTTDTHLAQRLGAPFLGTSAFLHVYLADFPLPVRIWCHHGYGGSVQATAGKVPHMERVMMDNEADIYLEGHIHRKFGIPLDGLKAVRYKRKMRIVATTKILGFTGSFLRGWQQGNVSEAGFPRGSYAEQRVLRVIPTGGLLITARPVKEEWGWRLDMFVSA